MKKLTIFMLGMFLLVGVATAVELSDRDAGFIYRDNEKIIRDSEVDSLISTVVFTTDKICSIPYDHDEVNCIVCFEFDMSGVPYEDCVPLEDGGSEREDQTQIDKYVNDLVNAIYPKEEITYVEREMKDDTRVVKR